MKKIVLSIAVVVLVAISFVSCNQANTEKKEVKVDVTAGGTITKIKKSNILRVGTSGEQFPFTFKHNDGKLDGLDIKIANAMAKRMGVEVEFVQMEFDKLIPALNDGKIDIIFSGMTNTLERNMDIAYSQPYFKTGKAILSINKAIGNADKEAINKEGIKIAVFSKSTSEDFVKKNYPNATLIAVATYEEVDSKLVNNEIDAFIGDMEICESISYSNLNTNLYLSKLDSDVEYIAAAVSADDALFFNLVENYIRMVNDHNIGIVVENLWLEFLN